MGFYYNDYDFDPKKKYLILYRGNFSPCTKGHFSLLTKYIGLENVYYYISHLGSDRHGISYDFSKKMWKLYIYNNLTDEERKRIKIRKMINEFDVLPYVYGFDCVIFLRGKEENDVKAKERERIRKYSGLYNELKYKNIKLDYLIIDRPEINVLSSTLFIQSLKNNSTDEILKTFMPNLSRRDFKYIISKLQKFPLK